MTDTDAFANRLTKNLRHWGRWARRRGISCYRVYDRDLPEFPVAIDLYEGLPHVQEFETRWEADEAAHAVWERTVRETIGSALDIAPEAIAFKTRRRQKGLAQYEKTGLEGEDLVVHEGGLRFLVNLHAFLDTGLFLDHRQTRSMIRERAQGKRLLNLFCYTGSFTVYAAAGGARETVSVDLSNTYLDWTHRNLELNGTALPHHRRVRADALRWLDEAVASGERFDLIVLDPPSFSNSKKMTDTLDVQRDHPRLVNACLQLLGPDGELYFSNNRRGFRLHEDEIAPCAIEEITHLTLPEDFARSRAHRCWRIRKA